MRPYAKSWSYLVLLSALLLLLSQCSQNRPEAKGRGFRPNPAATLADAYAPWVNPKLSRPDRKKLPSDLLEALGEKSLQDRDFETSLLHFLEILKHEPARYDLRYKVGVIFLLTGQLEAARRELALVLLHRPEMLEAHEALGLVHLQEKQYPLALQEFQTVLTQDPKRAKARYLLGISLLEAGQAAKALPHLKEAAALEPRQAHPHIALGDAYLRLKDYQQALNCLKKAQMLAPQNQKLHYHLGLALAGQKRYPEALEAFLRAGDEAQAYNNIGVHYFMDGCYEEAARCFQRALELRPTFYHEAKANLNRALEKLHQVQNNDG
jgi:tetratricopeptide (TPR) repeat protein